jgi:Protein of unknown function (DUF2628)
MKLYSVYARPDDAACERAVFVPQAFSWPAFVFGGFWALAHRMWIVGAILLAGWFAASALPYRFDAFASLALSLMAAIFASDLRGWSLKRRGYNDMGEVAASDLEEAEVRFYANLPARPTAAPAAPGSAPMTDPLGLFDPA